MHLKIWNETVRRNIEIFKIILKRTSHSNQQTEKQCEDFRAFVHRINGEIRFVDLSSEPIDSKEWIVISFHFSLPKRDGDLPSFEVLGSENSLFSWDGFYPDALAVLKETVKTIQLMARFLPYIQNLNATFRELSQVNLDSFLDEIPTKDLIHEAWYQVTRQECEKLLMQKATGSFLFRQDEFAAILEGQLTRSHKRPMKCITLTYLNEKRRVVDFTLVKRRSGWIIYNDDPCLSGEMYPTVKALLSRFDSELAVPVLNR